MKYLIRWLTLASAVVLVACGGGGGCTDTPFGKVSTNNSCPPSSTVTGSKAASALGLIITDSGGAALSVNTISSGLVYYAQATLVDTNGAPIANQIVSFSTDSTIGTLSPVSALTNTSGVARVQISPASLTTAGAALLTAQASVGGAAVTNSVGYQTGVSNVALGAVSVTPSAISALQTASVSTTATVNGVAATPGQVSVTLTPACGYFTSTTVPAITVSTTSGGAVAATWHSVNTCAGTVQFTASAAGATPSTGSVSVTAAQPANILYSGATPSTLVVSSASSGAKQSVVRFTVVDSGNTGMANQGVTFSLDSQAISAGVKFNVSGVLTSARQVVNTDSNGIATVTIQSSTFPTPVSVTGTLSPTMTASSAGIVVTAGMPSQNKTSVGPALLNIEGYNINGVSTTVTFRTSDRQGNPVPTGTAVSFIASHGTIGGSCLTDASSACSVSYTTSGVSRPADGVVAILAYANGEESFTDLNGNNVWDAGETFFDMGQPYRDDNHNGAYNVGEQLVGTAVPGATTACPGTAYPSVPNTCDGTWTPSILARDWTLIGLSSGTASITATTALSTSGFTVQIGDGRIGSVVGMAVGSTVTASVSSAAGTCAASPVIPPAVPNTLGPTDFSIVLNGSAGGSCSGATVTVAVTTPSGSATSRAFSIP